MTCSSLWLTIAVLAYGGVEVDVWITMPKAAITQVWESPDGSNQSLLRLRNGVEVTVPRAEAKAVRECIHGG